MTRPRYESSGDRDNEQAFKERLAVGKCIAHKLPISYHVDFFAMREGRPVWIEYKRRRHHFGQYDDVMLSALKWWHGTSLAIRTGGTFVFAVEFDDQTRSVKWSEADQWQPRLEYGGRTSKTRDGADVEPVVHIEVTRFEFMWAT